MSEINGLLLPIKNHEEKPTGFQLSAAICVWQLQFDDKLLPQLQALVHKQVIITGSQVSTLGYGGVFEVATISEWIPPENG